MLGGRSTAAGGAKGKGNEGDKSPSYRVPGASLAARAGAAGDEPQWLGVARRAVPRGNPAAAQGGRGAHGAAGGGAGGGTDADGFQVVTRRKQRAAVTPADNDDVDIGDAQCGGAAAHLDAEVTTGDQGQGAGGDGAADAGGDDQPSVEELQRVWHDELALVRKLRAQGIPDDHPAMLAAVGARDSAEQAWRGAKEPAPASVRLGRAQAKLDKAVAWQADARGAMLAAEKEHRERMATLQAALDEATERVRWRRQQLQEVQEEVGAGAPADSRAQRVQREAIRSVHDSICGELGPTLAALVEQVDSEAPAWATLNSLLGTLATSKATLEHAAAQSAARFHIGEGGDQGDDWSDWSESHDVPGRPWGTGPPVHGAHGDAEFEQRRGPTQDQGDWGGDRPYDADETAQPMDMDNWWEKPGYGWGGAARWHACGHGKWARASWADQHEDEHGYAGEGDGPPPAARRRLEPSCEGRAGGGEQQAHQDQPQPTVQPPPPGSANAAGDGFDPEEQKRKHNERVDRITCMAIDAGISPVTSQGEELRLLDPHRLDEWVTEHFPAALLC